jgi:hypothetical protein
MPDWNSAQMLTERENEIFESLARDDTFKGKLYRDGVPCPDVYLSQPVRVLFVFREPNLRNKPFDLDMRAQIREREFRPTRHGELLEPDPIRGWWNNKVGALGHAVVNALAVPPSESFASFEASIARGERNHEILFRFGYMQIKKIGGGSNSKTAEIEEHAEAYCQCLKDQVALYEPHMIIGCGRGNGSPARLLHQYVLVNPIAEQLTADQRFTWWRYADSARPVALLEFNHPSYRGSRELQYHLMAAAVREIATNIATISGLQ